MRTSPRSRRPGASFRGAALWVAIALLVAPDVCAHRDGCHARHSCEPDTAGAYVCGDKGICSECLDNQYCLGGEVRDGSSPTSGLANDEDAGVARPDKDATVPVTRPANEFVGRVRGVADGDTITVQDAHRHRNTIRIAAIDAPEKGSKAIPGQSYSDRARRHLVRLVSGMGMAAVTEGRRGASLSRTAGYPDHRAGLPSGLARVALGEIKEKKGIAGEGCQLLPIRLAPIRLGSAHSSSSGVTPSFNPVPDRPW